MVTDFKKKQKRSPQKNFLFKLGGVIIIIIVILLVIADIKVYQKRKMLAKQIENLKAKIEDIENQNRNLKDGISKANEEQYIEKVAREELDFQRSGEKVVSFIEPPVQIEQNGAEIENGWQKWWNVIISWLKNKIRD